jgi:hypothetical protein
MLDWLTEMTAAELSEQAAFYATRASATALVSTRHAFGRLASQCAALAEERTRLTKTLHVRNVAREDERAGG